MNLFELIELFDEIENEILSRTIKKVEKVTNGLYENYETALYYGNTTLRSSKILSYCNYEIVNHENKYKVIFVFPNSKDDLFIEIAKKINSMIKELRKGPDWGTFGEQRYIVLEYGLPNEIKFFKNLLLKHYGNSEYFNYYINKTA